MPDVTYPLYPISSFLGFFLVLIPMPWHLQAWNSGTCFYMLWAALACLNQFINSVVWAGNALNPAPFWCEISIRIMMGASVGLPAASLCINRRLYQIASIQSVTMSRAEKRRAILVDTLICVLFPIVYIALQYVVQGHRFNILEDIGCYPALYNTLLTYFISSMWPIILGLVSGTYCALSLRAFTARRAQFSQFLSSNKSLTVGRYFRLMALATTEIVFTTPLAIFMIWLNATATPIGSWISWQDTHFAFSRVEQIPALLWRRNQRFVIAVEFTRWAPPLCALVFFVFFGFADEAKKNYRAAFWGMAERLGVKPPTARSASSNYIPSIGQCRKPAPNSTLSTDTLPAYASPSSYALPLHDRKGHDSSASSLDSPRSPSTSIYSMNPVPPTGVSCDPGVAQHDVVSLPVHHYLISR